MRTGLKNLLKVRTGSMNGFYMKKLRGQADCGVLTNRIKIEEINGEIFTQF